MKELILGIAWDSGLIGSHIDHEEFAKKIIAIIEFAYQEGVDYGVNCPGAPDIGYGIHEYLIPAIKKFLKQHQ